MDGPATGTKALTEEAKRGRLSSVSFMMEIDGRPVR